MSDIVTLYTQLLNDPTAQALQSLATAITFIISILAFWRTFSLQNTQKATLMTEQRRFLEMQWNEMNRLVISNSDATNQAAQMFGSDDGKAVKRDFLHLSYLNILSAASHAYRENALDYPTYDRHMESFFGSYRGDREYLVQLLQSANYHKEFQKDCIRRLRI